MTFEINPDYRDLQPLLVNLPSLFEQEGKTIYKSRNELRVIEVSGQLLNVKKYRIPIFINRIAYSFIRKSKACRAYQYAQKLKGKGIDTPDPIAFLEIKSKGLLCESYFVSKHLTNYRLIREFSEQVDIVDREDIVVALSSFAARLHEAGILHLDFSGGNILFQKENDGVHFWLVDLNRMRFCKINQKVGCKNFERLRGSDDFFRLLASSYANERGFDPNDCYETIMKFQRKSVQKFLKKSKRRNKRRK